MSKFDTKDKLDRLMYRAYNVVSDLLFHLNPEAKRTVNGNLAFKDRHKGQRCFILGTGPSLKALTAPQIDALRREVVFGANSLYKADVVASVVPKYYALLDNLYWEQWSHAFDDVVARYSDSPPVFITDMRAKGFAERASPQHQHLYVYSKKYPVSRMTERMDTNIYAAMNVISFSVLAAMYMGFKEIYLLGCDYNAFCSAGKGHAYDDKSETAQFDYNLAFYLKFYWITTEFHYLIAKLGRDKGVSIVNLTPGSLLDAYPRVPADQVLGMTPSRHPQ